MSSLWHCYVSKKYLITDDIQTCLIKIMIRRGGKSPNENLTLRFFSIMEALRFENYYAGG